MDATAESHDAAVLRAICQDLWGTEPGEIWEIGSRDGVDAVALAREFLKARVDAFEPNPDTWPILTANIAGTPRITAHNVALSDTDGTLIFHKIDPARTVTSWPDGNPGASSLFVATGRYPVEQYVQTPITVMARRGDSVVKDGIPPPDVIWMDTQGAEMLVLRGLGDVLAKVRLMISELSLREVYSGQALAIDVIPWLRRAGFRWYSVQHTGAWQFDAVFVRSRWKPGIALRDSVLRRSLATRSKPGIATSAIGPRLLRDVMVATIRDGVELSDSAGLSSLATVATAAAAPLFRGRPLPPRARRLFEMSQRTNPLQPHSGSRLPPIDILIPCAEKDLETLGLAIAGARASSQNPINAVYVVGPERLQSKLAAVEEATVRLVDDEELVGSSLLGLIDQLVPENRRGWVVQQVAKLLGASHSDQAGVLVVDADTVLLRPRTWLTQTHQLLIPVHEFHEPYEAHFRRCFVGIETDAAVSWVAHHQLMVPSILHSMFGSSNEARLGAIRRWLSSADFREGSSLSEYHTYGTWLRANHPMGVTLARWGNLPLDRSGYRSWFNDANPDRMSAGLASMQGEFVDALSVSFHDYDEIH